MSGGDDRQALEQFASLLDLPFTLVGREAGDVAGAWGVRRPGGSVRRTTFVVAPGGRVAGAYHAEVLIPRHVGWASKELEKLSHARRG